MATNKHATIRYHALDQCFSNSGRKYFMEDLIEACNLALYEYTGKEIDIKKRQIFDDIKFMESDQGWSIHLERYNEGRKVYYRYSDKSFSIKNQIINESEANQVKETLLILSRFKGLPQFEWIEDILVRLETVYKLKDNTSTIVGFDHNEYLKGLDFFSELFNCILNKKVLGVKYKSFNQNAPSDINIHPYFLKQFNGRWFLFGFNPEFKTISNLALDRIVKIKETKSNYIENTDIDFKEYFEDLIGVTYKQGQKPEKVLIEIAENLWPYLETKPLHGSQKIKGKKHNSVTIELTVVINYELISLIFSLGEGIKVLAPIELQKQIKEKAEKLLNNYFSPVQM
jgi:predicted DNA-binding transcriptional regulator YafY